MITNFLYEVNVIGKEYFGSVLTERFESLTKALSFAKKYLEPGYDILQVEIRKVEKGRW